MDSELVTLSTKVTYKNCKEFIGQLAGGCKLPFIVRYSDVSKYASVRAQQELGVYHEKTFADTIRENIHFYKNEDILADDPENDLDNLEPIHVNDYQVTLDTKKTTTFSRWLAGYVYKYKIIMCNF